MSLYKIGSGYFFQKHPQNPPLHTATHQMLIEWIYYVWLHVGLNEWKRNVIKMSSLCQNELLGKQQNKKCGSLSLFLSFVEHLSNSTVMDPFLIYTHCLIGVTVYVLKEIIHDMGPNTLLMLSQQWSPPHHFSCHHQVSFKLISQQLGPTIFCLLLLCYHHPTLLQKLKLQKNWLTVKENTFSTNVQVLKKINTTTR